MRIVAIANQKGGCGKTTTAINLAASLSRLGRRVLLVDCDPQAHATMGLGIDGDSEQSMYQVMSPRLELPPGIADITVTIQKNFDLAPASTMMSALEQELADITGRENRLHRVLSPVGRGYDFIILDCPPSIGHLCFNALRASTEVIVPIDMSLFSLRGVIKLVDIILFLKNTLGHDIQVRALITMYDVRTRYSRHVLEKVREEFGSNVFETVIRYTVRLRETVDYGLPVGEYDCHSIGHKDYEKLADEIVKLPPCAGHAGQDSRGGARYVLEKAESYISTTGKAAHGDWTADGFDDPFADPPASSYSEMIDLLAVSNEDFFTDEDEF